MNKYNLLYVKIVSKFELRRLCKAVGATALVRVGPPTPDEMGHADKVFVQELGSKKVTVFQQLDDESQISTIVLRGATMNMLDDIERAIDDAVNTAKVRACVAASLWRRARVTAGCVVRAARRRVIPWRDVVAGAVSRRPLPARRRRNGDGACSPHSADCRLNAWPGAVRHQQVRGGVGGRAPHPRGERWTHRLRHPGCAVRCTCHRLRQRWCEHRGTCPRSWLRARGDEATVTCWHFVSVFASCCVPQAPGVVDAAAAGIYDSFSTKFSALGLAADAALTVLRVDQIIMSKQAGGPKPRDPQAPDAD